MKGGMKRRGRTVCAAATALSAALFAASFLTALRRAGAEVFPAAASCAEFAVPLYASPESQPQDKPSDGALDSVSDCLERQDKPVFVNGRAYTGDVIFSDGAVRADPAAVAAFLGLDGARVECTAGELFCEIEGRCIFCPEGITSEKGCALTPLEEFTSALALSYREADGAVFIDGAPSLPADADEYYDAEDLYWLSRIIFCESGSEPMKGKIAVGNVVLNRVASGDFPDTVKEVVFDRKYGVQFSPAAGDGIYSEPDRESVAAAKLCLEGVSLSESIMYFMNPDLAENTWISENREAVMTIGRHTFYS